VKLPVFFKNIPAKNDLGWSTDMRGRKNVLAPRTPLAIVRMRLRFEVTGGNCACSRREVVASMTYGKTRSMCDCLHRM